MSRPPGEDIRTGRAGRSELHFQPTSGTGGSRGAEGGTMKARRWLTATVLAALLSPAVARAEGLQGRFAVAFQAGTQSILGGTLLKGTGGRWSANPSPSSRRATATCTRRT